MNFEERLRPHTSSESFKNRRKFAEGKGRRSAFGDNSQENGLDGKRKQKKLKGEKNKEEMLMGEGNQLNTKESKQEKIKELKKAKYLERENKIKKQENLSRDRENTYYALKEGLDMFNERLKPENRFDSGEFLIDAYERAKKSIHDSNMEYIEAISGPKKYLELFNLGFDTREAKGMSPQKSRFIIENKIKKEDWHKWEDQYRELVDSGSFTNKRDNKSSESIGYTQHGKKEAERTESVETRLFKLGFSRNEIENVLTEDDVKYIFNNKRAGKIEPLTRDEWIIRKRNFYKRQAERAEKARGNIDGNTSEDEEVVSAPVEDEDFGSGNEKEEAENTTEINLSVPRGGSAEVVVSERELPDEEVISLIEKIMRESVSGDIQEITNEKIAKLEETLDKFKTVKSEKVQEFLAEKKKEAQELKDFSKFTNLDYSFEDYKKMSPDERLFIFWHGIRRSDWDGADRNPNTSDTETKVSAKEDVTISQEDGEKVGIGASLENKAAGSQEDATEVISDEEYNNFVNSGEVSINVLEEIAKVEKTKERALTPRELAIQQAAGGDVEKVLKESLKEDGAKDEGVANLRGVSLGAKEFLKSERASAQAERERQDFSSVLESNYEDFDKETLIGIAKQRGLPSGGEKQALIERIIKDDLENNREDFGFADDVVHGKLSQFGMSERDMIKTSPEFFKLSPDKQIYLLSKLEQKIYFDAELKSKAQNEENIKNTKGLFKKIGAGMKKGWSQVALRDSLIKEIKEGGLQDYREDMKVLTSYLGDAPELKYVQGPKGKPVPVFEYVEKTEAKGDYETLKSHFNYTASQLGEIPYEWSLSSATSSERKKYQDAVTSYSLAKEKLLKGMTQEGVKENPNESPEERQKREMEIVAKIAGVDGQVKFGQYLMQNPDIENKSKKFFEKVLGGQADRKLKTLAFVGAGYGARFLGKSLAFAGVGLGISAAVGGFMSYRKKNLEFSEKELKKRYGAEVKELGVKNVMSSKTVHERLEGLINNFEKNAGDEKRATRSLEAIKSRLFVTEELLREGRVNFGSAKEQTLNQYKLSELMSRAAILVQMNGGFAEEKTREGEVFEKYKDFVGDELAAKHQSAEKTKAALKGAAIAAGGFMVGYGIRHLQESGFFSGAWEKIKDALPNMSGVDEVKNIPTYSPGEAGPIPVVPEETYSPVTESVMVGGRGAIGGIDDLQKALKARFGENVPPQYQEFLSKDAHDLAREWGFYRPGEENQSAVIMRGAKFGVSENGAVQFVDHLGNTRNVFTPEAGAGEKFDGNFFDAGRKSVGETFVSPEPDQTPSNFDQIAEDRISQGWEHSQSGTGDVFTRYEKLEDSGKPPFGWGAEAVTESVSGYPTVRGEWQFVEDANGNLINIDTKRAVSDDVIKFRRNPRNFMSEDLSKTDLLAKTDSFAVKTLTNNRQLIEQFLVERNILNAGDSNLTPEQEAFLSKRVAGLRNEISDKTGGAFDGKYEETGKSRRITFFNPDSGEPPRKLDSIPDDAGSKAPPKEVISRPSSINTESLVIKNAADRYGEATMNGNIASFDKGYVGFGGESIDHGMAKRMALSLMNGNKGLIKGYLVDEIITQSSDGKYQVVLIYNSANPPIEASEVPGESKVVNTEKLSKLLDKTAEHSTYQFDSKDLKGYVRFVYKDGDVLNIQTDETFNNNAGRDWNKALVSNWKESAIASGVPVEDIEKDIKTKVILQTILDKAELDPKELAHVKSEIEIIDKKYKSFIRKN
jgi:hypothetical protein